MSLIQLDYDRLLRLADQFHDNANAIEGRTRPIEPPEDFYPYHRLINNAVDVMRRDALTAAQECAGFADSVEAYVKEMREADDEAVRFYPTIPTDSGGCW